MRTSLLTLADFPSDGVEMPDGANQVHIYGFQKEMEFAGTELLGCGSLRTTMMQSSPRFVAMTRFSLLQTFVAGELGIQQPPVPKVNHYVLSMNQTQLDKSKQVLKWHYGIVNEGSLLYTPAGYYIVERPNSGFAFGLHASVMPLSTQALQDFAVLLELSKSMPKTPSTAPLVTSMQQVFVSLSDKAKTLPASGVGLPALLDANATPKASSELGGVTAIADEAVPAGELGGVTVIADEAVPGGRASLG